MSAKIAAASIAGLALVGTFFVQDNAQADEPQAVEMSEDAANILENNGIFPNGRLTCLFWQHRLHR